MAKLVRRLCPACNRIKLFRSDVKTCGCQGSHPKLIVMPPPNASDAVEIALQKLRDKRDGRDRQVAELLERVATLEQENDLLLDIKNTKPAIFNVPAKASSGKSESAAVFLWSDFHIEEPVFPAQVSGKNSYSLEIADARFRNLLHGGLAWWKIASRDTNIKTIVLALLGDFITSSIHDDLAESNQLPPSEAIHKAYGMLVAGIKFMLANTPRDVAFIIPCHSGNHGRMTQQQRISTEAGNSLEYFMFLMLRDHFQDERRVKFIVQPGYHSYVSFFDGAFEIRFHHGHQIKYSGGVGGLTVPALKAIAQWNRARRVDLDCFGHHHQRLDGGSFVANGSLIGYNAYAVSIKASYEPPSQTFFLVNREYAAKTLVAPIFVDKPGSAIDLRMAA
jgi:Arc/MetJ-type ribon-helix-helix transcriptional regulator